MVGCLAKFSSDHHAFNSPCLVTQRTWNLKWCTGDVVLVGIRDEEHGTVVLDDHVEVLLQGTVGDKARPLLFANHMPWAVEVRCKQTPIRTTCWSCVPRQDLQLVNGSHVGLVGLQGRHGRPAEQTVQNSAVGSQSLKKVTRLLAWQDCWMHQASTQLLSSSR